MASRRKAFEETDKITRIAIVNSDKCKPKRCRQECKKSCPVVRMGKLCIEVSPTDKIAGISETLCIGCGICVKVLQLKLMSITFENDLPFSRNAHLKLLQLSTYQVIWRKTPLIGIHKTPSSCTGFPHLVQVNSKWFILFFNPKSNGTSINRCAWFFCISAYNKFLCFPHIQARCLVL